VYFQMPSKSRSAAGGSRYSAIYAAELTLEGVCIQALWLSAFFTLDQRRANHLDICAALLFSPNKITDVLAIVGVVTTYRRRGSNGRSAHAHLEGTRRSHRTGSSPSR
jgi:hypothetical protein